MKLNDATINGIPSHAARIRGELTNATDYTTATMTALVLRSSPSHWLDRVECVTVQINLQPGYSATDHLFDRLAAKVINLVHGRLFASAPEIEAAARRAPRPECAYEIEIEESGRTQDVPADLAADAEALREEIAAKDAAKRLRRARKNFAALALQPVQRGEQWVIVSTTTPYADERYSYQLNIQPNNYFVSLSYPGERFVSGEAAEAKLAAYAEAIAA